jgi:hypothetical protein
MMAHNRSMERGSALMEKHDPLKNPGEGEEDHGMPMHTMHHEDGTHTTTHEDGHEVHHENHDALNEHLKKHMPEEEHEMEEGDDESEYE